MRILLDTNVLVSGLINARGFPGRLLEFYLDGGFDLVYSEQQDRELRKVLQYDRIADRLDNAVVEALFEKLAAMEMVADAALPEVDLSDDPDDNLILATAIAGDAELVVSGDKRDVLSLGTVEGIPIITARQAAERLGLEDA